MNKYWIISILFVWSLFGSSCDDFLERNPDQILTDDQVFSDAKMVKSILANFYGGMDGWGQDFSDLNTFTKVDDACLTSGAPDNMQSYGNDQWRVYNYKLIRSINQFLEGLRASSALSETERNEFEGEARFIRAWVYFNMCRGLGGVPIVYDQVFEYSGSTDVLTLQVPRSKEYEVYDYIISECSDVAGYLPETPSINAARATKWAALMLKARAAIYAGSLANYNNKMAAPIVTTGGEVGIPAEKAAGYYETAFAAAKEVIASKKYDITPSDPKDLGRNFYEAVCIKDNNKEVIWARDYAYPGSTHLFTFRNIPASHAVDPERCFAGPVLNLVEEFEYKDDRDGKIRIKDEAGNFIMYDNPEDAFANKDARLWGTVIYPGAEFRSSEVTLQAGQKIWENNKWVTKTGKVGSVDSDNRILTSINGPVANNENLVNKSGFFFRKFLDEDLAAATNARKSAIWFPRFRISEAYMIACEAAFELGKTGEDSPLVYINKVRERAGISQLTEMTFDDIVRECRVEFAMEDHRYWDLKRWRLADKIWNGVNDDPNAQLYALFPYQINNPGADNDKKWVFEKIKANMAPYPRHFELRNYYNFFDNSWLNKNQLLVKNPYQ